MATKLTLDIAMKITEGAKAEMAKQNIGGMSFVVLDVGGNILLLMRVGGAGPFTTSIVTAKAQTALGFNTTSLNIAKGLGTDPAKVTGISAATGGKFMPIGGGILIKDENGETIGAAAAGGAAPETDEAVIAAGVVFAGLKHNVA